MKIAKLTYKKPIIIKENKMTFSTQIIKANGKRIVYKQCSSCHSCR